MDGTDPRLEHVFKSKRQLEKEREQARALAAERETAEAYGTFIAAFEPLPSLAGPSTAAGRSRAGFVDDEAPVEAPKRKGRQMDAFLDELKHAHADSAPSRSNRPPRGGRGRSASPPREPRRRYRSRSPPPAVQRERTPPPRVWPVLEPEQEKFVRAVADKSRDHPGFLDNLPRDGKFAILFDRSQPACHFLNMLRDPKYVIPPPAFTDEGDVIDADAEGDEPEGPIGKAGRERFAGLLRGLTTARESIARAMAFAIEHTASADEIVDMIVQSLVIAETPVPRKMARLYLVGDILANTHTAAYRTPFEQRLPEVWVHFGLVANAFTARMRRGVFASGVERVLDGWSSSLLVSESTLDLGRRAIM